jgi:hypothetical protein
LDSYVIPVSLTLFSEYATNSENLLIDIFYHGTWFKIKSSAKKRGNAPQTEKHSVYSTSTIGTENDYENFPKSKCWTTIVNRTKI